MEKRIINPWNWQESQGWSWGIEVKNSTRTLYCSGQVSTDSQGNIIGSGDMRGQIDQCLDNLEKGETTFKYFCKSGTSSFTSPRLAKIS